jgi:hypothetical protein
MAADLTTGERQVDRWVGVYNSIALFKTADLL